MALTEVNQAWESLENALREMAPKTYATLGPRASEEDLKTVEKELGISLPEEFLAFYRIHNGEAPTEEALEGLFEWGYWMPLLSSEDENVVESWSMCVESYGHGHLEDFELTFEGPVRKTLFDRKWVPFCTDYSGNYLCFDFNPPARGTFGQILYCDYDGEAKISVVASSISELLSQMAEEIQSGKRNIDERTILETTVRIPNIKQRPYDSILSTPTLKEMGIVIRILDPLVANDSDSTSHFLRRPDVVAENSVAFSVYSDKNPCEKVLEGYGGDTQVVESRIVCTDRPTQLGESGLLHRRFDERYFCLLPIFYWNLPAPIPPDAVLEVTLKSRKRS